MAAAGFQGIPDVDGRRLGAVDHLGAVGGDQDFRVERYVRAAARPEGRRVGSRGARGFRFVGRALRVEVEFRDLAAGAVARHRQIGAVGGRVQVRVFGAEEDQARLDDRWRFCRRRMDVADREGDVLVDRAQRADDEGRPPFGVEADHRWRPVEGDEVVDRQSDPGLEAFAGDGRFFFAFVALRSFRRHGQVVDPDQRAGRAFGFFERGDRAFRRGFRIHAQALGRVDDDVFQERGREAADALEVLVGVDPEVGDPEVGMAGRLREQLFKGRSRALSGRRFERGFDPRFRGPEGCRQVRIFFAGQRFPFLDTDRTVSGRRHEGSTENRDREHQQQTPHNRSSLF